MSVTFNERTRRLLDGKTFATVATLDPDGAPQTSVVWIERDGDAVLFSATAGRRKGEEPCPRPAGQPHGLRLCTGPGATALTRTPRAARSSALERVSASSAAFDVP